eukprot:jgi/Chrzof1/8062/UNPLg00107.t1
MASEGPRHSMASTLGTAVPIQELTRVYMHMMKPCKMGISFWPTFRFNPPERPSEEGKVKLLTMTSPVAHVPAVAAAAEGAGGGSGTSSSGSHMQAGMQTHANPLASATVEKALVAAAVAQAPQPAGDQPAEKGSSNTPATPAVAAAQGSNSNAAPNNAVRPSTGTVKAEGNSTTVTASSSASPEAATPTSDPHLLHISFTRGPHQPPDEFNVGAKFLGGIPFPFLSIRTTKLEGTVNTLTGEVRLQFVARFISQTGSKVKAELDIRTDLITERAEAHGKVMQGERLKDGKCTLVAAASVPKTSNWFANAILWLPAAATAKLPMRLEFLPAAATAATAAGDDKQRIAATAAAATATATATAPATATAQA